jgi:enterochelin esterase-like enzyme
MRRIFRRGLLLFALFAAVFIASAADDYKPGPDSFPHPGIPVGEVKKYSFANSKLFPGTVRDYWVYVPRQYDPAKPACLWVNQDGVQFKAPAVFDNLIARHEMPVTIGVFVMHGRVKANSPEALDRFNRSYEYDGLGDTYARFILDEILPEVEGRTTSDGRPIRISKNPNDRGIGGASSGAICAFTAAWEGPDAFRRVFSSIGTYIDKRGRLSYPVLIRKMEAKPLRIFLQDGSNDLNGVGGNWFLDNQEMLSALEFSNYEVNHIWGDGGHNAKHATAIFPDAMRWLWKDWPKPIETGSHSQQTVAKAILPGEAWKLQGSNSNTLFPMGACLRCKSHSGAEYEADPKNAKIWMTISNQPGKVVDAGIAFNALCLTPDQSLLLADNLREEFVYSFHINPDGTLSARQAFHHLYVRDGDTESGAGGMAVDTNGTLYVCTPAGIQMCDQVGRMQGIISAPQGELFSDIILGETSYALGTHGIFARKLNVTGVRSSDPPIKPRPTPL